MNVQDKILVEIQESILVFSRVSDIFKVDTSIFGQGKLVDDI